MPDRIPHRFQPHYCRECGEKFIDIQPSPHVRTFIHGVQQHGQEVASPLGTPCGRSCTSVEQPEERESGRRMYGKGVERPAFPTHTERWTYENLFPPEE